jgi:hypothetical protein
VLAAVVLRRNRPEATFAAVGALTGTILLFVALVFATLSAR